MQIVNATSHPIAPLAGRIGFPGHSLTLIVKATFDLKHGAPAEPAEEPIYPTGDEFHPDDDEMTGSCRYASDFVFSKPCADLLLAGSAHTPGGLPTASCPVVFQVGRHGKRLRVTGDRHWQGPVGFRRPSSPAPFSQYELRYENSFGGEGFDRNPVGIGYRKEDAGDGSRIRSLPNIEEESAQVRSPGNRPAPAGFGPLGRFWKDRARHQGTYKKKWLKERWPWYPEDFDYATFNAAPPDMQVPGYLHGDESLRLENLHPIHAIYESRLPGIRIRCFLNEFESSADEESTRFHEVEMNLDTLWVDADAEKLVLVWRGVANTRSDEFEEMQHVYVMSEPIGEEAATLDACHQAFLEQLAAMEEEIEAEAVEADDVTPEPEGEGAAAEPAVDVAALRESMSAGALAILAAAGAQLTSLPDEAMRMIDQLTEPDEEKLAAAGLEEAEAALNTALEKAGIDPNRPPPVSDKARSEQVRMLAELGADDPEALAADPDTAILLGVLATAMSQAGLDPENPASMIDKLKAIPGIELPGSSDDASPEPEGFERVRPLTREIVEAEAELGLSFVEEDFSGLDLSELTLAGLDFQGSNFCGAELRAAELSGAILEGANFDGANLEEAILDAAIVAEANLAGVNLASASLAAADLTRAKLARAILDGANLEEAIFAEAELAGVSAVGAQAPHAIFSDADLSDAKLGGGDFTAADFSRANLERASFEGATLTESNIEGVVASGADFREADLTRLRASGESDFRGACFVQAKGDESIWEAACLDEADFSYAEMHGANFLRASMQRCVLYAANMRGTRLMRADLREANVRDMNLFEGSFEKADLSGADLRGSNLYAVEFYEAELRGTRLEGANLKMTKLA